MINIDKKTATLDCTDPDNISVDILNANEPLILKGLVKNWALVNAGLESNEQAIHYLKSFYTELRG